jgi:hypothetical protein
VKIKQWFKKQIDWARGLKENNSSLKVLIVINLIWSIASIYADWEWLSQIPKELIVFTSICSLYPPLLTIWYSFKYFKKSPPAWFTLLVFFGITSYGILAQFYFPLLMSWVGFNLHDFGSMFWVAFYGLQSLIIFDALRPVKLSALMLIICYFTLVDLTQYFYPTFVDFIRPGYPLWMKYLTVSFAVAVQILTMVLTIKLAKRAQKTS